MAIPSFYERLKESRKSSGSPDSEDAERCVHDTVAALISQPTDARKLDNALADLIRKNTGVSGYNRGMIRQWL